MEVYLYRFRAGRIIIMYTEFLCEDDKQNINGE